jgi:peptide/nickel transport system substrate-binding protein
MDAASLARNDDVYAYYGGWGGPIRLVWNVTNPLFHDKVVRQALTMALDRRAIVTGVGLPEDTPISDGTYTSCQFERREIPPAWPYDTTSARRILESAGWRDSNGDAVLDRDGVPFQFLTIVAPRWEPLAILAQSQLARIGVQMELQMLEASVVFERFQAGDFVAAIPRMADLESTFGQPDAPSGYDNARVRELVDRISQSVDREDRDRLTRELAEIYYDEIPGTFLAPRLQAAVARSWLRGLDGTMTGFPRVERLWIERDR